MYLSAEIRHDVHSFHEHSRDGDNNTVLGLSLAGFSDELKQCGVADLD
jgi:hypothetical protein